MESPLSRPSTWAEIIDFHARLLRLLMYLETLKDDYHLVRRGNLTALGLAESITALGLSEGFDKEAIAHLIQLYISFDEQNE